MAAQELLFHETFEDALAEVMSRCGGRKAFAQEMFSAKPAREAHNHVDACLNPERREKFSPAEVLYIARRGREVGCHSVMRFLCVETRQMTDSLATAEAPQPPKRRNRIAEEKQQLRGALVNAGSIQTTRKWLAHNAELRRSASKCASRFMLRAALERAREWEAREA